MRTRQPRPRYYDCLPELWEKYQDLLDRFELKGWLYVPSFDVCHMGCDHTAFQFEFLNAVSYDLAKYKISNLSKGFPDGIWHMFTLTVPKEKDKAHLLEQHQKALGYFQEHGIDVYHAVIEKSSIFHIHYILRLKVYAKNLSRDVSRLCCKYVCQLEKKVTSLQSWNGLCKYVMKRDYDAEKASTQVETLCSRISYNEGCGYTIDE